MRYRIENYIALKLHNNLEELQEVVNGFGVVECDDLDYTNGFLVWNEITKKVEHKYFNPALFEKWNGYEIVEDIDRKNLEQNFSEERKKEAEFKTNARTRVETSENDIILTQEAVNFIIFGSQARTMSLDIDTNGMAAYLASQVIKKAKTNIDNGRSFYNSSIEKYPEMKTTIDNILAAEGESFILE